MRHRFPVQRDGFPVIVHLASFPRSGNSLLQRILRANFEFQRIEVSEASSALDPAVAIPGAEVARRSRLPAHADRAYLKTHARPFGSYSEDEWVVQVVRHPGAALWSYFRFAADRLDAPDAHRFRGTPPTLEAVIEGRIGTGSWSAYHRAWGDAAGLAAGRYLAMRYEDVVANQAAACARLSAFLAIDPRSDALADFAAYQRQKSGWDLRGTSAGYEQFYSRRQLELLWNHHGETAAKFGYQPPDFNAAAPDEQVRRLSALTEAAWEHARKLESHPWRKLWRRLRRRLERVRLNRNRDCD